MKKTISPYLDNPWRLSDVIAAIQALGAYPWGTRKTSKWLEKLGEPLSGETWDQVFNEHPEFFRLKDSWASLRWRHAYDRTYDADLGEELSVQRLAELSDRSRKNLTRKPLEANQIEALMNTAVEMHSRALAQRQDTRWWWPILAGLAAGLFGFLGAVLGAVLK